MLDTSRSFRAAAMSPLALMALMEMNSPLSPNEVQFATIQSSSLAFSLCVSEWWLLDFEAIFLYIIIIFECAFAVAAFNGRRARVCVRRLSDRRPAYTYTPGSRKLCLASGGYKPRQIQM